MEFNCENYGGDWNDYIWLSYGGLFNGVLQWIGFLLIENQIGT